MGETKDLVGRDAIDKIKHIAEGEIAMLCTFTKDRVIESRPMGTQGIGDDATFWFFSRKDSAENLQMMAEPAVHLIYAVPSKYAYLSLDGTASISRDAAKIAELWNGWAKTWFTEGKDDPNLTLVTVTVHGGRYWDTRHGKMISLAKIAIGAVTGKTMDGGVKGTLAV
jgi:general stress protein 26